MRPVTGKRIGILAVRTSGEVTAGLIRLAVEGRLRPVIDEVAALEDVPGALAQVGRGDVWGKVVVRVSARPWAGTYGVES